MKVSEIVPGVTDLKQIIADLKIRATPEPNVVAITKETNVRFHDIMDETLRPDKPVKNDNGNILRYEPVNRIPLDFQNLIISDTVNFAFGNPVIRHYAGDDTPKAKIVEQYIERVLHDNMSLTMDREVARLIFTYTEVAEYWFPVAVPKPIDKYGFQSNFKMKGVLFSAENGNKLYPKNDQYGNLIAFSREFKVKENVPNGISLIPVETTYFETFTSDEIFKWKTDATGNWSQVEYTALTFGKMPIVYGCQKEPEYENVKKIISRLELLLSNHAEVNDYHAGPKILASGNILGWGQKGSNNMILQAEKGADAKYLSWDSAPESVQNEINTLLSLLYVLSRTPNVSFESVQGLGVTSGIAIKLLFMPAHLKVTDKETIFLPYHQRRYSILTSYLKKLQVNDDELNAAADNLEVSIELDPYMIADDKEQADVALALNGNMPIVSQETSVKEFGGDDAELKRIQDEAANKQKLVLGDPTS